MAEKDKYIIKVEGKLVEVTPEIYYAYFRMERQERGQEEKKQQHDVFSYDALDNCETAGISPSENDALPAYVPEQSNRTDAVSAAADTEYPRSEVQLRSCLCHGNCFRCSGRILYPKTQNLRKISSQNCRFLFSIGLWHVQNPIVS